jgi:glutamate-1-semialdehyde 2,1-aminomutase
MAAGAATLRAFTPELRARLNELGDRLRDGFARAFAAAGIRGQAAGQGSLSQLHLSDRPLRHARDSLAGQIEAGPITQLVHLGMLRRGIASSSRLMYCISAPMQESDVDAAAAALEDTLRALRPVIEKERPALLG